LVVRSLTSSLSATPVNGTVYTVGTPLGGGFVDYFGITTSFTSIGLTPNTLYYYFVFATNHATCLGGPLYLTTSPLTENQTTLPVIPISGNKTVGPTANFSTLTAAFAYLNVNGINGALNLILQSTYLSSAEPVFPIPALFIPGASAVNTVTVYPSASGLSITSASATGTLNMDGVSFVTFDGRVNATGSTKDLVIENTNVAGYVVQLINDARNNTFKYCLIKGVETSTTLGTILFSTTTGAFGNSNNLIDNCDVRDGATTPANLIYSSGTSGVPNINNTVSNCNLFNWFLASTAAQTAAINLLTGSSDWTITGNSFYQTASRTYTRSGIVSAININNTVDGYNFNFTDNFIGGILPSCGGTAMTLSAMTGTPLYRLISISTANGAPSFVQGNTISNIAMTTANTGACALVYHANGHINIINNTIGSQTVTGNITVTNSGTSVTSVIYGFLA
jgi:hypothetical protein